MTNPNLLGVGTGDSVSLGNSRPAGSRHLNIPLAPLGEMHAGRESFGKVRPRIF